jgi:hypothetical protein
MMSSVAIGEVRTSEERHAAGELFRQFPDTEWQQLADVYSLREASHR